MQHARIPFALRGRQGWVGVTYGVNGDPASWGCDLLGSAYDPEQFRGFPVVQATVELDTEGYAAMLGWIQILDWGAPGDRQKIVDRPPQLASSGIPWAAWGVRPSFFDAPSTSDAEFTFRAYAFLAFSPDAAITAEAAPLCGFAWGFDVTNGEPQLAALDLNGLTHWPEACGVLRQHCPGWRFLDAVGSGVEQRF